MPGVMILEGMAQVCGLLAYCTKGDEVKDKIIYFAGIDKARFRKVVTPGDQIIFKAKQVKEKRKIIWMEAQAYVEDSLVAEAELMATFA